MQQTEKDTGVRAELARNVSELANLANKVSAAQDDLRQTLAGARRHLTTYRSCIDPLTSGTGYVDSHAGTTLSARQLFEEISGQIWEQISLAENRRSECTPEQDDGKLLDYTVLNDMDPEGMVDAYEDAIFEGIRACMLLGIVPEHFDSAAAMAEEYGLCSEVKIDAIQRAFDSLDPDLVAFATDVAEGKIQMALPGSDDARA